MRLCLTQSSNLVARSYALRCAVSHIFALPLCVISILNYTTFSSKMQIKIHNFVIIMAKIVNCNMSYTIG